MKETSAGCCVTVFYFLSVVVVGTVVTRERRDVGAMLACSAANCIRVEKSKLQSKRNKQVVFSYKNLKVPAADYARDLECDFVVSLTKVLEGDLPDLDEPVIQSLPLSPISDGVVSGDDVVEPVEGVDEVLDGQADVVRPELETFEFDDDGEASECRADLGDEDRDDAVSRLVFEVDDG